MSLQKYLLIVSRKWIRCCSDFNQSHTSICFPSLSCNSNKVRSINRTFHWSKSEHFHVLIFQAAPLRRGTSDLCVKLFVRICVRVRVQYVRTLGSCGGSAYCTVLYKCSSSFAFGYSFAYFCIVLCHDYIE